MSNVIDHLVLVALQIKHLIRLSTFPFFFFFNDTATTEIYTLSLHDALPILWTITKVDAQTFDLQGSVFANTQGDRKSTRLNSSHGYISYAVFCLKKKKKTSLI